jgi:NADH dehydrogenase
MKILLTGGTGYVGQALREKLRLDGHDVRLLVRRESAHKIPAGSGYDIVLGDVMDSHACLRAVDGCQAVVHLVGIIREFPNDGTTYVAMHTEATFNVLDAARRMGTERFVHMSALGARADARSRYHTTKFEAESIVTNSDLDWTVFRPSVIFSPGSEFTRQLVDLVHRPLVPIVDGGKALLQPVSLENLTDAMARSLSMPETQGCSYDVGGPDRVRFADILDRIADHYKLHPNTMKISSTFMKPVVRLLQRFESFPLTVDQLEMLVEDNICDTGEFTKTFRIAELDSFEAALPSLLEAIDVKAA